MHKSRAKARLTADPTTEAEKSVEVRDVGDVKDAVAVRQKPG